MESSKRSVKRKSKSAKTAQETEYEVEDIVDHKNENDTDYYLVKWKGWDSKDNSWVAKQDLFCPDLLSKFEQSRALTSKRRKFDSKEVDKQAIQQYLDEIFKPSQTDIEMVVKQVLSKTCNGHRLNGELISSEEDLNKAAMSLYQKRQRLQLMETGLMMQYLKKTISVKRTDQLERLGRWEANINKISRGLPTITVENNVDLEGPPANFTYVRERFAGEGVTIPKDPVIGCECDDCCASSSCCGPLSGSKMVYNRKGKLRVPVGTPIYECNKICKCGPDCPNRVVQKGARRTLTIFRTADGRGWGVKTQEMIRSKSFVIEYAGEIITTEEAEKRGVQYDSEGRTYLFDLDFNDANCLYTVDAAHYGNIAHFINHSCDPNLAVFAVWDNCLDVNLPRLALFSQRDIAAGEELTFDYASSSAASESATPMAAEDATEKNVCRCGAQNCRKILFSGPRSEGDITLLH